MTSLAIQATTMGSSELSSPNNTPTLTPLNIKAAVTTGEIRPAIARASTEPASPNSPSFGLAKLSLHPTRQRNRSPYARHLRSRSSASIVSAPAMTRAHSSPTTDSSTSFYPSSPLARPSSPHYSSVRRASPLRYPIEESTSFFGVDIDQTIAEHDELDIKPRPSPSFDTEASGSPLTPSSPYHHAGTFPRSRRAPSPLQHFLPSPINTQRSLKSPATLKMSSSSPALRSTVSPASSPKWNESYPTSAPYAQSFSTTSSMPSTPTSFRSRSPSISSLETIPDSPDAEEAAVEETERDRDTISKLKAAIEREGSRRGSFEGARGRGMFKDSGTSQDKRKRWSVCGAERRGDLDLETIWED